MIGVKFIITAKNCVFISFLAFCCKLSGEKEVDFVAENKEGFTYYQVSYTKRDEKILERELSALQSINEHYSMYILTMDIDPECDYDSIRKINVLDWLLKK